MKLQRNIWYVAAWPEEVTRQPLERMFLNKSVVLYRTEAGEPVAIDGICPHRFAPLSLGTLVGDILECKYHGLGFDRHGACVRNPHGDRIPSAAHLSSYRLVEQHGLLWIWMGDQQRADASKIPDVAFISEANGFHSTHNYLLAKYRYDILVDNLMDLSHVDFLHRGSFATKPAARATVDVKELRDEVVVVRTAYGTELPPGPRGPGLQGMPVDVRNVIHWHPGQVIGFEEYIVASGEPFPDTTNMPFAHMATPASSTETHYFFCLSRNFDIGNRQMDAAIRDFQRNVIDQEDGKMLEAVARNMGGRTLAESEPLFLNIDAGAMRVRKVMERLLSAD